jgi:5-deoxy-glucuronate isomerase
MREGIPHQILLSPENDPLQTLTLERLRLDHTDPVWELKSEADELLLYGLIGAVAVEASTDDGQRLTTELRPVRARVDARGATALRLPAGMPWTATVRALDRSADYLLVRRRPVVTPILPTTNTTNVAETPRLAVSAPMVHLTHDDEVHQVGEGAWRREVRTFPTPEGYHLHAGETLNPPGHWSSWPSHFPPGTLERYAEWEEVMFVVTPAWGLVDRSGRYVTGERIDEVQRVSAGDAFVAPLGAHPVIASPHAWLLYVWVYSGEVLRKAYPRWATDVQSVYADEVS